MSKDIKVNVRLDESDHEKLKLLASEKDVTVSWLCRQAVREYIKQSTEKVAA